MEQKLPWGLPQRQRRYNDSKDTLKYSTSSPQSAVSWSHRIVLAMLALEATQWRQLVTGDRWQVPCDKTATTLSESYHVEHRQAGYYSITLMSCPNCVEGAFLSGEPKGTINSDFQGAYYAPGPPNDGTSTCKRAILLFTDAFGLPLKNCKIMADDLAKRLECDVWIPDYFVGRRRPLCAQFYFFFDMIICRKAFVSCRCYDTSRSPWCQNFVMGLGQAICHSHS